MQHQWVIVILEQFSRGYRDSHVILPILSTTELQKRERKHEWMEGGDSDRYPLVEADVRVAPGDEDTVGIVVVVVDNAVDTVVVVVDTVVLVAVDYNDSRENLSVSARNVFAVVRIVLVDQCLQQSPY